MAKSPKVATSFGSYGQTNLLRKAQQILQSLTDNPNFPTIAPSLNMLSVAIDAFGATLANQPSKTNTAAKKVARDALTSALNQIAMNVQMISLTDVTMMLSSGYSLTKSPQPVGVLSKPENFKVLPLYNGSAKLSLKKIDGADSYCFEYTSAPVSEESSWASILSTKANAVVSGLNSGSRYVFRVAGVGSNPTTVYSDEVTSYIL